MIKNIYFNKIKGTYIKPRLTTFSSNKNLYVQCIDDINNLTLLSSSTLIKKIKIINNKKKRIESVAIDLCQKLLNKGIKTIILDNKKYTYYSKINILLIFLQKYGIIF
jgi:ribosomal protein L18